jgi:KipI family sensor histidine kinase inhibitor
LTLLEFGSDALIVEVDGDHSDVTSLWRALSVGRPAGVEDVVAGFGSVLVRFSPADPSAAGRTRAWVGSVLSDRSDQTTAAGKAAPHPRAHSMPVVYDGEDLDEVAGRCRLSREEVVRRHWGATYTVAFLGFSPGFGYLTGGDPLLRVPRRASPRRQVAVGSVAVADGMSAVYPSPSPGGWQLLGRTDAVLFDALRRPPALLEPGDVVRFHPVGALDDPGRTSGRLDASPEPDVRGTVEVIAPGPFTTTQDRGRPGWAHAGIPRAGAADLSSFVLANRAVGNPDTVPVLEMTASGPTLRFSVSGVLAVRGARVQLRVDGTEVDAAGGVIPFVAGAVVECGAFRAGVRAYLP